MYLSTVFLSSLHLAHEWLLLLLLCALQLLAPGGTQSDSPGTTPTGLFPPIVLVGNSFASRTESSATSTCGLADLCSSSECLQGSCNTTCPYGEEFPGGLDLLRTGELAAGVQQVWVTTAAVIAVSQARPFTYHYTVWSDAIESGK